MPSYANMLEACPVLYIKDIILIEIVFSDRMDLLNIFSTEVSIKNDLKVLFSYVSTEMIFTYVISECLTFTHSEYFVYVSVINAALSN